MRTASYLRLEFLRGGRERPQVDCWGLYRLIVGEMRGVWLDEFGDVETPLGVARTMAGEAKAWLPVAPGAERELDLVLMFGIAGAGRDRVAAPQHVGCVVEPGLMIDIEDSMGVMIRPFRSTLTRAAMPSVANRVRGIFRPAVLA